MLCLTANSTSFPFFVLGISEMEIILEGTQKVSGKWLYPGDIRIGLANRGYGPLIAGPEGVTVLVIFADGHWPAVTIGAGDGSTLGTGELLDRFSAADEN